MKKINSILIIALLPGISFLSSCATTRGFGQDLQKVGQKVERRADATGGAD